MNRPEYNEKLKNTIKTCNTHRERMLYVTHEYPDNEEEIADGLNQLSREAYYLSSILDKLTEYIQSRKLLK